MSSTTIILSQFYLFLEQEILSEKPLVPEAVSIEESQGKPDPYIRPILTFHFLDANISVISLENPPNLNQASMDDDDDNIAYKVS